MGEFGHSAAIGPNFCIDSWGWGPFVISAEGKSWRFEDSDRFGPSLIDKKGEICKRQWPGQYSPFWRAHRIWVRQGRRTEDGVICIWDEPKLMKIRMITRRTSLVVDRGEEDGKIITLPAFFSQEKPHAR